MRRLRAGAGIGALLGALCGCGGPAAAPAAAPAAPVSTPAATASDRAVPTGAPSPCPRTSTGRVAGLAGAPSGGNRLPAVTLACLSGGPPVALGGLRGPAVVNLWASWCSPCRQEMPQLQALHARAGARLLVLGVVTDDSPDRARSTAAGLGVHYASVLDRTGAVRRFYGYPGPPVTLLVDRSGVVAHRIIGAAPPLPQLSALVSRHLGVQVAT